MRKKVTFLLAISLLVSLTACGGAQKIEMLTTPDVVGNDSEIDSEKFFFGSDEKVFPSSSCDSQLFRLLSNAKDFKQVNIKIKKGKLSDVQQQLFNFAANSDAEKVLSLAKDLAAGDCNEKNSLFTEYVFSPSPVIGLGDGVSGLTWTNSGSQTLAFSCSATDVFYFEAQLWMIQKGNQILITKVSEVTCGDDELPLGEDERTRIGEESIKLALG
jgi:hypothetical protein